MGKLLAQNGRMLLRLERLETMADRARTARATDLDGGVALEASLDSLGLKYDTDKASAGHNYLVQFDKLLTNMRNEPIDLLEIGVHTGSSIRMWHDFFPAARIVGIDINPINLSDLPRFTFFQGSQVDPVFLHTIMQNFDFRLVIDDGSHMWAHQIFSFQTIFPFLAPGSIYICEDIQTSFGWYVDAYKGGAKESAAAYFLRVAQLVAAADFGIVHDTEDPLMHTIVKKIRDITFIPHCVIIKC